MRDRVRRHVKTADVCIRDFRNDVKWSWFKTREYCWRRKIKTLTFACYHRRRCFDLIRNVRPEVANECNSRRFNIFMCVVAVYFVLSTSTWKLYVLDRGWLSCTSIIFSIFIRIFSRKSVQVPTLAAPLPWLSWHGRRSDCISIERTPTWTLSNWADSAT